MVFLEDRSSVFAAPIAEVWKFVGSGSHHSDAHRHRKVRRRRLTSKSGQYSWEQDFQGRPERFTMRWTSFHPVGIAYEVLEGPFRGSKFLLYYTPIRNQTRVSIVGEFVSSSISPGKLRKAVDSFFAVEFEQDHHALLEGTRRRSHANPR
jgi:hypothetical protein